MKGRNNPLSAYYYPKASHPQITLQLQKTQFQKNTASPCNFFPNAEPGCKINGRWELEGGCGRGLERSSYRDATTGGRSWKGASPSHGFCFSTCCLQTKRCSLSLTPKKHDRRDVSLFLSHRIKKKTNKQKTGDCHSRTWQEVILPGSISDPWLEDFKIKNADPNFNQRTGLSNNSSFLSSSFFSTLKAAGRLSLALFFGCGAHQVNDLLIGEAQQALLLLWMPGELVGKSQLSHLKQPHEK